MLAEFGDLALGAQALKKFRGMMQASDRLWRGLAGVGELCGAQVAFPDLNRGAPGGFMSFGPHRIGAIGQGDLK